MDSIIDGINKAFESRVRLGIMSILTVNKSCDFNYLKDNLQVTDGNLASHLKALEKMKMIRVIKKFIKRKPNTTYEITEEGVQAFSTHIDALTKLLKG